MTDKPPPPDLQDLARRYLDLWQDHLKAVATDRDASETLARTMALMSSGAQDLAASFASATQQAAADGGKDLTGTAADLRTQQGTARRTQQGAGGFLAAGILGTG